MKKLIFVLYCLIASQAFAAPSTVLHGTAVEIAEWQSRTTNGPYKDEYDNRIKVRADAFVASPDSTWSGQTTNSCWIGSPAPGRDRGERLRDAAFVYLLTNNGAYSAPVRTHLLAQAAVTGTDATNSTRWCANSEMNNVIELSPWLRRLAYAYSYTKDVFSAGEQTTMNAWFLAWGNYLNTKLDNRVKICFPNYQSNDWTKTCGNANKSLTHYGGNMVQDGMGVFQNQEAVGISGIAVMGRLLSNATLLDSAERYVKGFLRVSVFADGTVSDQYRWIHNMTAPGNPGTGYLYAASALGSMVSAADHLERAGRSIYEFSTSEGVGNSVGGPKSIGIAVRRLADMQQHNVEVYGSQDGTLTDCERIDDFLDRTAAGCTQFSSSHRIIHDVGALAVSNVFYKDSVVATSYGRTPPSSPTSGGYDAFGGDWGNYPGARFLFGGMENISDAFSPVTPPGETPTINVASASSIEDANASTWAVTLASPCASGNLYLMLVGSDFNATVTFPIGTDLNTTQCPGGVCQFDAAYHTSTGAEGSSITVATTGNDRSAHQTFCLSSQHASSPPEIAVATGTGTSADPPSITPSWGSDDETTLFIGGVLTNAGVSASGPPAGYSNLTTADSGGTSQGVALITARKHALTASENPGAFTLSSSNAWVAFTIAVRPQEEGAPTYTLTQSRFRFEEYYNTSESSPTARAPENVNINASPQGKVLLRMKVRGNVINPPSVNLQLRYSKNGGGYTALADVFSDGVKFAGTHVDAPPDAAVTTEQLTSDETDNVPGRVALRLQTITWNPTLDSEGEFVFGIAFDPATAAPGDTYDFRIYQEDGTALDAYTTTPRVTIIRSVASGF